MFFRLRALFFLIRWVLVPVLINSALFGSVFGDKGTGCPWGPLAWVSFAVLEALWIYLMLRLTEKINSPRL
jgi:hypothetical protein